MENSGCARGLLYGSARLRRGRGRGRGACFFEQDGSNPGAEVAGPGVCQVDETVKSVLAGPTIPRLTAPLDA